MSTLGDVFETLKAMSLLQLLLAFIACIGYVLAQGRLFAARGRRIASAIAGLGAVGFVLESAEWTLATMVLGFAVAGMGLFVAMVWLTSWALGFAHARPSPLRDSPTTESSAAAATMARSRSGRPTEPAHI